jgi:CHAT domain-containing protein
LVLSPDGLLNQVSFAALPTEGGYLVSKHDISYLNAGRDLLRFTTRVGLISAATAPIVVANPDFDLRRSDELEQDSEPNGVFRGGGQDHRHGENLVFEELTGTLAEGISVSRALGTEAWIGEDALEGRVKQVKSPRILHFATHGFFIEDDEDDSENVESPAVNPLLRSGLALAGANARAKGFRAPAEAEDGLLLAEDVATLDLTSTEIVVLSACDTGLGRIRTGEGVYGLQRAFVLAGAQALIMSLWKVPDTLTKRLMESFYRDLGSGLPAPEALLQAQRAAFAQHPDPFAWGAFIFQGCLSSIRSA